MASVADALIVLRGSLNCVLETTIQEDSTEFSSNSIPPGFGCVLVMENPRLEGIVTERNLVRQSLQNGNLEVVLLSEVITTPVLGLQRGEFTTIFVALNLMRRQKIRHLPILEPDGSPLGLVTISSLHRELGQGFFLRFRDWFMR